MTTPNTQNNKVDDELPDYWERLDNMDKERYMMLRATLASPSCKNRRNKSNETFQSIVENIKSFVYRGDDNDYNRGLVCGLIFLNEMMMKGNEKDHNKKQGNKELNKDYIALNTKQLKLLLNKCKSSINGSFHQIGYEITEDFESNPFFAGIYEPNPDIKDNSKMFAIISKLFPEFESKYKFVRQWSIREREFDFQVTSKRRKPISYLKQQKQLLQQQNSQMTNGSENEFNFFSESVSKKDAPVLCNVAFDGIFDNEGLEFLDNITFS